MRSRREWWRSPEPRDKIPFLLGNHGANVRMGTGKRSRKNWRGGKFFFDHLLEIFPCVFFLLLLSQIKCLGWSLGDEEEGEERRRRYLPCLPWRVGRGGRGSNQLQWFSQSSHFVAHNFCWLQLEVILWFSPRLGWWDAPVSILITSLASPSGWEAMTPVLTAEAVSTQNSWQANFQ